MSASNLDWKKPEWLFNKVTGYIFGIILVFTTFALMIGAFRLFYSVYELAKTTGITGNYLHIFSDVLTLVILLELSRSLFQYFMDHKLRIPVILDAGIIFVLRDIMIGLFEHKFTPQDIYAYSALFLVLGAVRIGLSLYYCNKNAVDWIQNHNAAKPTITDVAVGNILGSNIFNLLGIPGVSALLQPLPVHPRILQFDQWVMLGAALILLLFLYTGHRLSRVEGGLLLIGYSTYLGLSFTVFGGWRRLEVFMPSKTISRPND